MAYAKSGNATKAYKEAGYKVKNDETACVNASRLLTNARVQARLQEISSEIASDKIMQPKEMQEWFSSIIRGEVKDGDNEAAMRDRLKAAELLGRMQGSFISRQEIDVQGAVPVVIRDDV